MDVIIEEEAILNVKHGQRYVQIVLIDKLIVNNAKLILLNGNVKDRI